MLFATLKIRPAPGEDQDDSIKESQGSTRGTQYCCV